MRSGLRDSRALELLHSSRVCFSFGFELSTVKAWADVHRRTQRKGNSANDFRDSTPAISKTLYVLPVACSRFPWKPTSAPARPPRPVAF